MSSQVNLDAAKVPVDGVALGSATSIPKIKAMLAGVVVPVVKPVAADAIIAKELCKRTLQDTYELILAGLGRKDLAARSAYLLLLGEVMMKFGRLRYEENYPSCMVMMRGSLNVQLAAIGVVDFLSFEVETYANLSHLEEALFQHQKFTVFDEFIINSDVDVVLGLIKEMNLTSADLNRMGFTLSWFANGLMHTDGFRASEEIQLNRERNCRRFDQVYALCEKVLVLSNTEAARLELAEMYYNGLCNVALRKDPKNIAAAHQWLDRAKELNPSERWPHVLPI